MNLFYQPHITPEVSEINFDKEESRHINKVLRKNEGDILYITNGKGDRFKSEIISSTPKKCIALVNQVSKEDALPYKLHLAVAPTKLNDRFEWFLEKATEIGITEITPIICDHSERKVIKKERMQRIIIGAMKQSLSYYLPKLNDAISFKDFLALPHGENFKGIAHCEVDDTKIKLTNTIEKHTDSLVLIGPEGDFSLSEIQQAKINGYMPISLGERRLRTETAAIIACHSFSVINY